MKHRYTSPDIEMLRMAYVDYISISDIEDSPLNDLDNEVEEF